MFSYLRAHPGLLAGDALAIAVLTLAGFSSHGTLTTAGTRIWATLLPLLAAWVLTGGPAGVFARENVRPPAGLWRPFWAMLLAAPLFGLLRALALGEPSITAVFILVIGGVGAPVMAVWRGIYWIWIGRREEPLKTDG